MSSVNFPRNQQGERFPEFVRSPGAHAAGTVLIAAATTMALGNHGFLGTVLFGAGILAALYLFWRWLKDPFARVAAFARRPRGAPPVFVPPRALLLATLVLIPTAIGANVFKDHGDGVKDVLNVISVMGLVSVVAFFALLAVATTIAWARQDAAGR